MASAAEQLAANLNFGAFAKAEELKKRIWFTLGALVVYRLGTYIPLPGINIEALAETFKQQQAGMLGLFNMFSGGAVGRMAIFALNIMPYISASIIIQLLTSVVPTLEALKKEGESGRKVINQYTRYLTVVLATFQAYGIAVGLEASSNVVADPGTFFRISTTITLVGGTMFLMWLGEQITARGIGNGSSLIIFAGIVAELPSAIAGTLELGRQGAVSTALILGVIVLAVRGHRLHRVHRAGAAPAADQVSEAPGRQPRLRGADLVPAAEAQHLGRHPADLRLVAAAAAGHHRGLLGAERSGTGFLGTMAAYLGHGRPLYMFMYAALIVFFAFFYTAIVFNPHGDGRQSEEAWRLHPRHPARASARPSTSTRCSRASRCIGAGYLVLVCLLPEILISQAALPFYFGGTSLLIVVSVTMDTVAQVHGHLLAHQYEGLVKKAKLRGGRRQ